MNYIEGANTAEGCRFGIVVSRFNEFITDRLLAGALEVFRQGEVREDDILVVRVPGAFEIPLVARLLAKSGQFDAILCLGCVIRGETPHFEYISAETSRGIAQAAWDTGIPVIFGVLTVDSPEQALHRSDSSERNRGADAARSAIAMATLVKTLQEQRFHSVEKNAKK
ncbi:MAG: 6,7-dimethyl-8-ribityllumazine synthase [Nitrospirae bacterium]|nr:MAG: 6,7-dimethyl-8-ribityllumazine synthase [Nitrospirota bacterium]